MFPPELVTIACPQCGAPFQVPIFPIIDVKRQPELKAALLSGQLNTAQCPNCGRLSYIATPMLYHDPDKEFLAVYLPMEANLPEREQQKIIGELTNALMNALPPEERKGYFFTPMQFFNLERLVHKILELDGITQEMIEASRRKLELLDKLLQQQNDPMAFDMILADNRELLDKEFYMILTDALRRYRELGREDQVKALEALQERLLPESEFGRRLLKQRRAVEALGERPTRQQVQEAILQGDLDEVEAIALAALPLLDYSFFLWLAERIDQASGEEKEALEAKRDLLLNLLESLRKIEEEATAAAKRVAEELIKAEDLDAAIQSLLPAMNERVFDVLIAGMAEARSQGATELAERIQKVIERVEERLDQLIPPEVSLVFRLLESDYPAETKQVLEENRELVNDTFFKILDTFIEEAENNPSYDPKARDELIRFLKNIRVQATLL